MYDMFIGELFGTLILVLLGGGVIANVLLAKSKGLDGGWMVISTGWFIAVVTGVFVSQSLDAPNADINPAVTFAKYLLDMYTVGQMVWVWLAEIVGAFLGAVLVWLCYFPHWQPTKDPIAKLSVFSTTPAIRHYPSNVLCEIIGTMVLVIGVAAIFGPASHGHPLDGWGPYLVGVLVWGIGLSLGGPTGYAINPARDLGPRIAHAILPIAGKGSSDWCYAWVPIVGPLLGAGLGAIVWHVMLKHLH